MAGRLNLAVLGEFKVFRDGLAVPLPPSKKTRALLAYLALPPGQVHPRSQVAALLWGDQPEAGARASLRQALFTLRKALPAAPFPILLVDSATVALHPTAVEVDVGRFERLVAKGTPTA